MKKLLYILCLIGLPLFSAAQDTHSYSYDITGMDGVDRGYVVSVVDDGIILIGGSLCYNFTRSCIGIIKTDFEGNALWTVRLDDYPNSEGPVVRSNVIQKNNHYIVGGNVYQSESEYYMTLIEFDSTGQVYWQKIYEENQSTFCTQINKTSDGYLLYGLKRDGVSGNKIHFIKTDSEGNKQWDHTMPLFENTWSNSPGGLEILDNGHYLTEFTTSVNGFSNRGKVLQVLDENFEPVMTKNFWSSSEWAPYDWAINQAWSIPGGYAMASYTDTITPADDPVIGVDAHMIVGLDTLGEVQWTRTFPSGGVTPMLNFKPTQNGDLIGCGRTNNFNYIDANGEEQREDAAWMFRITNTGELIWRREYVVTENVAIDSPFELQDVVELPDGRIAAIGQLWEKFPNGGNNGNIWLLIVDENGCFTPDCDAQQIWVAVDEPEGEGPSVLKQVYFQASPNPASSEINVRFYNPLKRDASLVLHSPSGQLVAQVEVAKGSQNNQVLLKNLPEGMYILSLKQEGRILQQEKIVVIH